MYMGTIYETFRQELTDAVTKAGGGQTDVSISRVNKINRTEEQITVRMKDSTVAPSLDLAMLYEAFTAGEPVWRIAEKLIKLATEVTYEMTPEITRESAQRNLFFCLASTEGNEELVKETAGAMVEGTDLFKAVRWAVGPDASFLVKKQILGAAGMTEPEALQYAQKNTNARGWVMKSLSSFIEEAGAVPDGDLRLEDVPLYILKWEGADGSAAILIDGCLAGVRQRLGSNFYILPSSRHEVLILPESGDTMAEQLRDLVREINAGELLPHDKLSDNVYFYDGVKLTIAGKGADA
jgi:hypothetical protein